MQLKKLEAYGFKSFADRTEVDFDKGITAIVGPNGSGKSNISDAIKWVLGEQNVRNIRGVKAEDIIFAGSAVRKKMGAAEVSLYFDNDGTLPIDFKEVVVTRRLFRTGESEFFINKARCRLKDITNLFADTGIGHDSMGIISQNRMDEILNARPEEKRLFFEEAAGISKYRIRKKDAMRKLDETEENLQRVHDILSEIDNQLEPLRLNAEKAKQYQELQKELSSLRLTELYQKYCALEKQQRSFARHIQEKTDQEIAAKTAMQLTEGRQQQLESDILALEKRLESAAAERNAAHERIEKADSQIKVLEERRRQCKANRQRQQQLIKDFAANAQEAEASIAVLAKTEAQAKAKAEAAELELASARQQAKSLRGQINAVKKQRQAIQLQLQQLEHNMQSAASRLQVLEKLQSSYEGFGKSVKAILSGSYPWRQGICGAAAELIEVPSKLVTAIEIALGGNLQNIVTEDTRVAQQAIELLKRERLGRATFLPLSSIVVRQKREELPASAKGVLGWADELVQTEEKYRKVAAFLLGRTLVVDNLSNALALNKSMEQRLRIVTLEGELLTPGGALSGGSQQHKESSFLNRREDIAKLSANVRLLAEEKARLQSNEKRAADEFYKLDADAESLSEAANQLETKRAVLSQQVLHTKEQMLLRQRELARVQESAKQQTANLEALEKELSESILTLGELLEISQREQQGFVKLDAQYKAIHKERMDCLTKQKNLAHEAKEAAGKWQEIQNSVHKLELEASKLEYDLEQAQQEMLEKHGVVPERAAEIVPELDAGLLKKNLRKLDGEIAALGIINPNAPQEYAELQKRHDFLSGNVDDLEKARVDLLALIGEMENSMTKQFKAAFAQINIFFGEIFVKLFGGGEAKVQLADTGNVLESGVHIMVMVPGKKQQNLSVLSGGERALTVVALLFSFLKYRPAPFSVLDEIDAPLDEANIGRFGKFVKEYAENTQFIIVTHRKGTMEAADTMYGVTVEDAGVSKVLSVKLQDFEEDQ